MFNCKFIRRKWNVNDDIMPIVTEIGHETENYALGMVFPPGNLGDGGEIIVYNKHQYTLQSKNAACKTNEVTGSIELCYGMVGSGQFDSEIKIGSPTTLSDILKKTVNSINGKAAVVYLEGELSNIFGKYLTMEHTNEKPFPDFSMNFSDYREDSTTLFTGFGIICEGNNEIITPFLMKNANVSADVDYHIHIHLNKNNDREAVIHLIDFVMLSGIVRFADVKEIYLTEK